MTSPQSSPQWALLFFAVVLATALAAHWLGDFCQLRWTLGATAIAAALVSGTAAAPRGLRRHLLVAAVSLVAIHFAVVLEQTRHPAGEPLVDWLGDDRKSAVLEGKVVDGPILAEHSVAFDLRVTSVDIDESGRLTSPPPRIRVYYRTADLPPCSPLPMPGDRISAWATIQRFAPAEHPWRPSQRRLMEARGFAGFASIDEPIEFLEPRSSPWHRRFNRTLAEHRVGLERNVGEHLEAAPRAIAIAMLTGSRGELTPEIREPFDITSTGHILAISGLHFAVIAALVAFFIRLFLDRFPRLYRRWPRRMLIGISTLAVLAVYLAAIGAPVSARRAFGMTALAVVIIYFSPFRIRPLSALATTAGVLLLIRPSLVAEAGFQLSVCATGGILLFLRFRPALLRPPDIPGPDSEPAWRRWMRRVLTFAGVSVAATVATWPVLVRMTGEIPLAGLWTNLVVIPLVGSVIFPLIVAGAAASWVFEPAAAVLLRLAGGGLAAIHTALDAVAYAPGSVIRWGTPSPIEIVGMFAAAAAAIVGGFRPKPLVFAAAIVAAASTPGVVADALGEDTARVHFIDVGQGDATLVELPDGTTVLVDGGGRPVGSDPGLTRVVPYLRHRGIRRLDAVVVTHGDYDHYGGLSAVVRPFRPRRLFVDADETEPGVMELIEKMEHAGTDVTPLRGEQRLETPALDVRIRRPELPDADPNDRSLVVDFSYRRARVVLPGDLEEAGESWLTDHSTRPAAVLKAPHHGSNTSSGPELLDELAPAAAVASAGRHNRFGHPHPDVIERYERRDIDLFRTDEHGAVIVKIHEDATVTVDTTR